MTEVSQRKTFLRVPKNVNLARCSTMEVQIRPLSFQMFKKFYLKQVNMVWVSVTST